MTAGLYSDRVCDNICADEFRKDNTIPMNMTPSKSYKDATGKIDYTMTNDYMFRAVLQENKKVLTGLICSLLHLQRCEIKSVIILNPIELGKAIDDRAFVLDLKLMLNNAMILNIEMQVLHQDFWNDRSLLYLCRAFDNPDKGNDYRTIKPAYHIGILDFTPFPEYPEFYATNKLMNVTKKYIYDDRFTLHVLDLNQIQLATDEDKAYRLDYWAKLFRAKTWEELKMLAENSNIDTDMLDETCETIFRLNQDDAVRYWCEAREDGERIMLTYKNMLAEKDSALAQKENEIAQKDLELAALKKQLASLTAQLNQR